MLLSLAQVWLSMSQFMFELEVDLDSVIANSIQCGHLFFDKRECDVYFSVFCLREGRDDSQSTRNEGNCPLGRNTDRMNTYVENESNMRRITSQRPWPVKVHSNSKCGFTISNEYDR